MPEEKPAPAYVGQEAPPPLPPIQVLDNPPPPKKKLPIPLWMIILILVCFWLSLMATMYIYFIGKKDRDAEAAAEALQLQLAPPVVTVVITETPVPQKTVETIVDNRRILSNNQFGYSLETPDSWKTEDAGKAFWTYEGTATNKFEPQPYHFARVVIEYPGQTKFKIVQWLDLQYPPEFGDKKAPVKKKVVTNKNGVELLETQVNDPNGRLRYYFIANEQIVSLTFNTTEVDEVNTRLQPLYGQFLDSIKLIPITQPSGAKTQ